MNTFLCRRRSRIKLNFDKANSHLVLKGFLFSISSEIIGFSSTTKGSDFIAHSNTSNPKIHKTIIRFLFSSLRWPFLVLFVLILVSIFVCLPMPNKWWMECIHLWYSSSFRFVSSRFFVFCFCSFPFVSYFSIQWDKCTRMILCWKQSYTVKLKWLNNGNKNYEEEVRCQYFYDVPFFVLFVLQPIFHEALQWNIFGNLFL